MLDLPPRVAASLLSRAYDGRSLAYLLVDASLTLVRTGGALERYGLGALELGRAVGDQVLCLEGMLPLAEPSSLLPAIAMPSGRVADLHFLVDDAGTWVLLVDVTVEHDAAQRVQQKAYDMTLLSEREAKLLAQLRTAHRRLEASQEELLRTSNRLARELRDAERYVRSTLPAPFRHPFLADWRFVPSTELGGDSFGYHWVDADHFAVFLLDVCGHGVGAALLSVAAANTLRSEALPSTDFRDPGDVLTALNAAYQMEDHDDLFFTIWYGVYRRSERTLSYASAGHPPAILVDDAARNGGHVAELRAPGPSIGIAPAAAYRAETSRVDSPSRLFLFSDGAFEIAAPDGTALAFEEFVRHLASPAGTEECELDRVLRVAREHHGPGPLDDDLSIVKLGL